ncbi:MAG: hypothetical protein ACI9MR_001228 [Myxococcota bacterium]|jgi:hypothetical protein
MTDRASDILSNGKRRGDWTALAGVVLATLATAIVICSPIGQHARAAGPVAGPGEVVIFSTTIGAVVEIDGQAIGKLPLKEPLILPAGQHTIKVTLRGHSEFIDTFKVIPAEETELEIDLLPYAGIVKINSSQPGATIKVDGKVEGVTPFDKDVPVGVKVISITRPGFLDDTRKMLIKAGAEYIIDVALVADPNYETASDEEFYETWWFWTLVGVAVAGGATATAVAVGSDDTVSPPSAAFTLSIP